MPGISALLYLQGLILLISYGNQYALKELDYVQ